MSKIFVNSSKYANIYFFIRVKKRYQRIVTVTKYVSILLCNSCYIRHGLWPGGGEGRGVTEIFPFAQTKHRNPRRFRVSKIVFLSYLKGFEWNLFSPKKRKKKITKHPMPVRSLTVQIVFIRRSNIRLGQNRPNCTDTRNIRKRYNTEFYWPLSIV